MRGVVNCARANKSEAPIIVLKASGKLFLKVFAFESFSPHGFLVS
jgi:hypothetical protein